MNLSCTVDKFIAEADRVVSVCLGLVEGEWSTWAEGLVQPNEAPRSVRGLVCAGVARWLTALVGP